MKTERACLLDILEEIDYIRRETGGLSRELFLQDKRLTRAILHSLMIIGEAANRLSPQTRERHPGVPWRRIVALRNRLVHDYGGIQLDLVWAVVTNQLPALEAEALSILTTLPPEPGDAGL